MTATRMSKQSCCSILPIHPAAELFPLMPPAELCELGEDIRKHGLREPVMVMRQYRRREGGTTDVRECDLVLIDGRNRLDAMEAVGFTLIRNGKLDPTLGHKALGLEPPSPNLARAVSIAKPICRGLTLPRARFGFLELGNRLLFCCHSMLSWSRATSAAEMAKTSKNTAAAVRREMERRGQIAHVETREDSKGPPSQAAADSGGCSNGGDVMTHKLDLQEESKGHV